MRKYIIIITTFLLSFVAFAQQSIQDANKLYDEGKYEEAISTYENILASGKESAALYYNLGNAYYRVHELAPAILNYERSLLLNPNDEDVLYNLEFARSQTVDKIDTIDVFFLKSWINSLAELMSSNEWAVLCIITFILFLISALGYVFGRYRALKKTAFFVGCLLLIISLSSFFLARKQKEKYVAREYAIVFDSSVTIKSTPHETGTDLFELHEGTKVKIRRVFENPEWIEIQLEDGNTGWLKNTSIVVI
jgi:tetratricopeptide (TPR) repeat protein